MTRLTNTKRASNEKFQNVEQSFDQMDKRGNLLYFSLDEAQSRMMVANSKGHLQGVGRYTRGGHDWILATMSNPGGKMGYLIVARYDTKKVTQIWPIPLGDAGPKDPYNHPGGFQIIGDFLALAVQNESWKKSTVRFLDLTSLTDHDPPTLLPNGIDMRGKDAGAIGIANFTDHGGVERLVLCAVGNEDTQVFVSDSEALDSPSLNWAHVGEVGSPKDTQGVGLVVDVHQQVYMVGFRSTDNWSKTSYDDSERLYRLQLTQTPDHTFAVQTLEKIGQHNVHCDSEFGILGIHFRWGSGLHIDRDRLGVWATERNPVTHMLINHFPGKK